MASRGGATRKKPKSAKVPEKPTNAEQSPNTEEALLIATTRMEVLTISKPKMKSEAKKKRALPQGARSKTSALHGPRNGDHCEDDVRLDEAAASTTARRPGRAATARRAGQAAAASEGPEIQAEPVRRSNRIAKKPGKI